MSTLPSQASKGEKTKPKFQFLDINSLYRNSRGENLEKTQQKSSSTTIKHGMQSLGKVPNTRRAPANLPSLKAEFSGSDAAVPLVPPGAPGWGKQDPNANSTNPAPNSSFPNTPTTNNNSNTNSQTPTNNNNTTNSTSANNATQQGSQFHHHFHYGAANAGSADAGGAGSGAGGAGGASPQLSAHQAAIALPVTTTIPPQTKNAPVAPRESAPPAQQGAVSAMSAGDKLWSSVMSGQEALHHHPPPYHSAQFQHEFPSLSAGDGGPTRTGSDAPCPSGLSLRPQTEGSWTQGGARGAGPAGAAIPGAGPPQLGAQPQLAAQSGAPAATQQPLPPQYRAVMPPFMYKGNYPQGGGGIPSTQNTAAPMAVNGRNRPDGRGSRPSEPEEIVPRPIIKEEDLSRMDEIGTDIGWAGQDEIDYNQKLSFSDDESDTRSIVKPQQAAPVAPTRKEPPKSTEPITRSAHHGHHHQYEPQAPPLSRSLSHNWSSSGSVGGRSTTAPSRGRSSEDDDLRVQQCRKDIDEATQRAILRKGEEEKRFIEGTKQGAQKKLAELEEKISKRQDQERERGDRDSRSRTPNDPQTTTSSSEEKSRDNSFRSLTQIEGKSFAATNAATTAGSGARKAHAKPENGPTFSRWFQSDLPPRFTKQRHNSNSSGQGGPTSGSAHYSYESSRWQSNKRNSRSDSPDKPDSSDDWSERRSGGGAEAPATTQQSSSNSGKDRERYAGRSSGSRQNSEPRSGDYGAWSDTPFDPSSSSDDKRRGDDRRQVPGPITKERIEADDLRSEKRGLTQLKRGQLGGSDAKKEDKEQDHHEDGSKKKKDALLDLGGGMNTAWADSIPSALNEMMEGLNEKNAKAEASHKSEKKGDDYGKDRDRRNNRSYPQSNNSGSGKPWSGGSNEFHRSSMWSKRQPSSGGGGNSRSHKPGPLGRSSSSISGDYHATDSEGSEDHSMNTLNSNSDLSSQRSPKPAKKLEKENSKGKIGDKRDTYVPRGEPSRHGRGGGASGSFKSSRLSGMGKRIDGYGPPPSKSPFGSGTSHDEKDKKLSSDEASTLDLSPEEKTKQNQQALSAGLCNRTKPDHRRGKPKKDEELDTNSENSDEKDASKFGARKSGGNKNNARNSGPVIRRTGGGSNSVTTSAPPPPRLGRFDRKPEKSEQNVLCSAIADISLKNRDEADLTDDKDDKSSFNGDAEGFQEVKSKKAVKKPDDKAIKPKEKEVKERKKPGLSGQAGSATASLTQQQIQNIPSLMQIPINPPPTLTGGPPGKNPFERPRQTKLPPRFAKQKVLKAQLQQQQHGSSASSGVLNEVGDLKLSGQSAGSGSYLKEGNGVSSAWGDKPLGGLRNLDEGLGGVGCAMDSVKGLEQGQAVSQGASPNHDKDKTLLDGTTPPVNTIIFENTNFKSAPGARNAPPNRADPKSARVSKPEDVPSSLDCQSGLPTNPAPGGPTLPPSACPYNNKPMDLLNSKPDKQPDSMLSLSFKEDNSDMKLDFFGSDLAHLTDEKTTSSASPTATKNLTLNKPMHTSGNSTADSLNIKIASVKKVWETPADHSGAGGVTDESFSNSFVSDPNSLDPNVFSKGTDTPDDSHEGYSPSPNQTAAATTNVCKVKPTQQVSGGGGPTVLNSSAHQQLSGIVAPSLMGNPLSPPPMQPVIGAGVGLGQPPQQYSTNQHLGYQGGLSGSNQYGMSANPSPPIVPTVLYNSTPQLQAAAAAQTGLYGPFQIDQSGVLGGQGRSQYSQYANHYQTASSPYSTPSVYLQPTPAHPPPQAPQAPELFTNMNTYRLPANAAPFGQNQQLNNPNTVLISSTSNSLMSPSVKPSNQQISAIGTKAGGVGQAYQQQSQQGQQVFMYDPLQGNAYMSSGVMQRGPPAGPPVQNSVVAGLQSSSYYSGSTGGQTGYFQQPGSSTLQSAQLQQHQAGYGIQGNVFGTHNQSHTNASLQNYNYLNSQMQVAAAMNVQQYRTGMPSYLKNNQTMGDQNRPQQLKSPSNQEVLSSVFNTGSQISSPKSKPNTNKHPPPQSSPTSQSKYLYQGVVNHQGNTQRYPTPIQRPVNYQQNLGVQQGNMNNPKHRSNNPNNKTTKYYSQRNSNAGSNLPGSGSKQGGVPSGGGVTGSGSTNGGGVGSQPAVLPSATEIVKDSLPVKEEASVLKD